MNERRVSRRGFLQASAVAVAAPQIIASTALGRSGKAAASERVTIGFIGVGNRGRSLLRGFLRCKDGQCVAVADAYQDRREAAAQMMQGEAYADFRELLDRKDIDAVVVATPDHWHVPIAMAAARAGKDAYVEKPLGISVEQDLACRKLFSEKGRIFQYGTQQRSTKSFRFGCELVRSGRIGKVREIEVVAPDGGVGGSTEEIAVPTNLDYVMWLGPAPPAPYTASRCNPPGTYWIYDYSIGYLGGWGAHPLDIMIWGSDSDLAGPMEFEGTGEIPSEGLYDTVIHWDMKVRMADGVTMTFRPGRDSTKFIGDEGWVRLWRPGREAPEGIDAEPKSLLDAKLGQGDVRLVESPGHDQNFIDSVRSRTPAVSPIEHAVRSDVISHMCDLVVRTGRKIVWDPKAEEIVGDEEASKMLTRPMRAPWTL